MAVVEAPRRSAWMTVLARRFAHVSWPLLRWSALAGALGGLLGWAAGEPVNGGPAAGPAYSVYASTFVYFLILSAGIGAVLGALPGLLNRSWRQTLRGALAGLVVGGIGGGLGGLPAQFVYNALGNDLLARALGWAIVGAFIGLSPGAATRDRRRARRGIVGGLLGGFVGGLLFNLVAYQIPHSPADTGTASRLVADLVVGLCIGILVAAVEGALKRAWLTVISGRREGAQFILSKDVTAIGRDDRDDVILWGDSQMATRHARIARSNGAYLLESLSADAATAVNGQPVHGSTPLRDGDEIVLGSTRLRFHSRGKPPAPLQANPAAALAGATIASAPPAGASPAAMAATPRAQAVPSPATLPSLPGAAVMDTAAPPPVVPVPRASVGLAGGSSVPGLRLLGGASNVEAHDLPRTGSAILTVGRDRGNDIAIDDPSVSARHAYLRLEDDRWVVYDLDSTNGTYVSYSGAPETERRVERNALKEGSAVRFGSVTFRLERETGRENS